MKHRHSGPKIQYRTRRNRIRYRERPLHKITMKRKESRRSGRFDSKRDRITRSIKDAEDEGDIEEAQRLEHELQDYDAYIDELNKEAMEFIESKDVKMTIPPLSRKEWRNIIEEKPQLWKDLKKQDEAEYADEDINEMTKYWEQR